MHIEIARNLSLEEFEEAIFVFKGKIDSPISYLSNRGIPQASFRLGYGMEADRRRIRCIAFGETADNINFYIGAGKEVILAGHPTRINKGKRGTRHGIEVLGIVENEESKD